MTDRMPSPLHPPTNASDEEDGNNDFPSVPPPQALGKNGNLSSQSFTPGASPMSMKSLVRPQLASVKNQRNRLKVSIVRGDEEEAGLRQYQLEEANMFKVVIDGDDGGVAMRQVHTRVDAAIRMRPLYRRTQDKETMKAAMQKPMPKRAMISHHNGVYSVSEHNVTDFYTLRTWSQFAADVQQLRLTVGHTLCIRACSHRLNIMQERSRMFFLLNADIEEKHNYYKAGGVFADVVQVDNSVNLVESANAQELLEYVLKCYDRYPEERVRRRDGTTSTFRELMEDYGVENPEELTVAALDWQHRPSGFEQETGDKETTNLSKELLYSFTNRYGTFTPKFVTRLLGGYEDQERWMARTTEYSIVLQCTDPTELLDLATLMYNNKLPGTRNRWIVELRFLDTNTARPGNTIQCKTFQDQLDYLFVPLFRATLSQSSSKNAILGWFLERVGGFKLESVASVPGADFDEKMPTPSNLRYGIKANELYYMYYMYANLTVLNSLRKRKGLNTFQLRISANRRSGFDGLMAGYLLSDLITHATRIMEYPVLQYLCGMHHIGLTMSPLCDHAEGIVSYAKHPLPNFLHRCLCVSMSTEAPLRYHHNIAPLVEEYGTAQKMFRLSVLDMTEFARNSVVMSSFPDAVKTEWLGGDHRRGVLGNRFERSKVTNVRLGFREESWALERAMFKDFFMKGAVPLVTGQGRWHFLSHVKEVEYNTVTDTRIRFPRTVLNGPYKDVTSAITGAQRIARAVDLRYKYIWIPPKPWAVGQRRNVEADFQRHTDKFNEDEWTYAASDGVFISYPRTAVRSWPRHLPTVEEFLKDWMELRAICGSEDVKDFAHQRLENLEHKFRLHLALNHANEAGTTENKASSNRDIYQATKVDTHIHMAAGMTPKQILKFVLEKLDDNSDDIAMKKGDDILTLGQLFKRNGITKNLTVDQLNVQADHTLFERFDNFNNKYNPLENPDLRSLLLKTDNFMNGRYFAELIRNVFAQYSRDRYTYAENRVSIYGINLKEWDKLASWFSTHGMASKHNKLIIQVPRVYKVFRGQNVIGSFGQYLQNIFQPLWEASLHPSEHPTVHHFLNHVGGFDSVDNEATLDLPFVPQSPWSWTAVENPPYNYYLYYLYANIRMLNEFRASRGFSTFSLRPHCGESGADDHLYGAFLCANSICHGINLRNDPPMQYLYYLTQIGLHVSPLSNNALFLRFLNNPFPEFFRRGLNVSLSTDDPMMFHQTQEPLIEEYSIAARVWGLSPNDLCEIARNSVLQCGFDYDFKREAIGDRWYMSSSLGNDPLRTRLSDIRVAFRYETYHTEVLQLETCSGRSVQRSMLTSEQEEEINEQNLSDATDEVVLSTNEQEMEIMLREIEAKKKDIEVSRSQVNALRRQHRLLVGSLTDVGLKRQEQEEKESFLPGGNLLSYTRTEGDQAHKYDNVTYAFFDVETVQRLLRWQPMQPKQVHPVREVVHNTSLTRPLPTPPNRSFKSDDLEELW